jgi:hypothetical protein
LALLTPTQALKLGFSAQDYVQIHQHGLAVDNIKSQLELFKRGSQGKLAAATVGDGIEIFGSQFQQKAEYDAHKTNLKLLKFVPASELPAECLSFNLNFNQFDPAKESINAYIKIKITSYFL